METRTKPNREAHRILVIGLSWYNQSLRFDSGWGQNFFLWNTIIYYYKWTQEILKE